MTAAPELFVDGGSGFRVFPRTAPGHGVAPLVPVFDSSSDFWVLPGKIGTSVFVVSNSENISRTTFLKPKTAENRELALGIFSIG